MKKLFVLACLSLIWGVATPAHAASNGADAIYDALSIVETDLTPGLVGGGNFEKSVGGLSCQRHQVITAPPFPPARYECALVEMTDSARNDAAIYMSLNVQEVNITPPGLLGSVTWQKTVGGLVCEKQQAVVPRPVPSFACVLN